MLEGRGKLHTVLSVNDDIGIVVRPCVNPFESWISTKRASP